MIHLLKCTILIQIPYILGNGVNVQVNNEQLNTNNIIGVCYISLGFKYHIGSINCVFVVSSYNIVPFLIKIKKVLSLCCNHFSCQRNFHFHVILNFIY
jgi:hypothetical protein